MNAIFFSLPSLRENSDELLARRINENTGDVLGPFVKDTFLN